MTEVLGAPVGPAGRTAMMPGMGAGPTTVGGRRPPLERPRPGVSPHIRRRRARFAIAIILLLAITIGAVGWWLGSGAGHRSPTCSVRNRAPRSTCCRRPGSSRLAGEQWSEDARGRVISTDPAAMRRSAAPTCGSSSPRARSVPGRHRAGRQAVGRGRARAAGGPARDRLHDHRAARRRHPGRGGRRLRSRRRHRPQARPGRHRDRQPRPRAGRGPRRPARRPSRRSNLRRPGFEVAPRRGRAQGRRRRRRGHGDAPAPPRVRSPSAAR